MRKKKIFFELVQEERKLSGYTDWPPIARAMILEIIQERLIAHIHTCMRGVYAHVLSLYVIIFCRARCRDRLSLLVTSGFIL